MNAKTAIEKIARSHGFQLVRQRKHLVFAHPSGARVVTSLTPGCHRAMANIERSFIKAMGEQRR
jgi:predicted RNA binding protein YcfA (HicA-like mRNA interferase family)